VLQIAYLPAERIANSAAYQRASQVPVPTKSTYSSMGRIVPAEEFDLQEGFFELLDR
jgi:hypothetical protein